MPPIVRILPARPEDASAIAQVLHSAFFEHERSYTPDAFAATAPGAREIVDRMRQGPVWIAIEEGEVVGTLAATAEGEAVRVRGMGIAPSSRRRGIGRRLLAEAEKFAEEMRADRIVLSTTPFLESAIRLYERFGFTRSDEPPHDLYGTSLFTMIKRLRRIEARRRTDAV